MLSLLIRAGWHRFGMTFLPNGLCLYHYSANHRPVKANSHKFSEPIAFLRDVYVVKKTANPQYSIAAFARNLEMSASFVSRLLAGERPITIKSTIKIAKIFAIPQDVTDNWISTVISHSAPTAKVSNKLREENSQKTSPGKRKSVLNLELEHFKIISEWQHSAILNLTFVKNFKPNSIWISRRLGISRVEVDLAVNRLIDLKLLEVENGNWIPTKEKFFVNQKKTDLSVRRLHQSMCAKAREALEDSSQEVFDDQYFAGLNLAFDRKRMPEFKEKLSTFSKDIIKMSQGNSYSDVYYLNLQLFPLTKNESNL